ncbi:uncharacterized protein EI90DRAFT_3066940 [Cantharellus anzutake]|uniref:uncharacterized protein n=1 Tax=Cantharellus anzutake TaxID=1750568 RepID=UPI00190774E7|nr:uncharacterized protein EI90DRAFT_3066940 [Cantharellus anzutake]KAF8327759.1 hypothetical protein EI90DRAFT_3066940 [Cantharellus anzutake]
MPPSTASPAEGRRGSGAAEQSTPQANRTYTNMASTPSTRTVAAQASSSSLAAAQGSPSSHRTVSSQAITVESALAVANGSHQTALEKLVSERNSLQNENALLWKHLEKTKSTAVLFKKDLDRIRAERDRLLSILEGFKDERRQLPADYRASSDDSLATRQDNEKPDSGEKHQSDPDASASSSTTKEEPIESLSALAPSSRSPARITSDVATRDSAENNPSELRLFPQSTAAPPPAKNDRTNLKPPRTPPQVVSEVSDRPPVPVILTPSKSSSEPTPRPNQSPSDVHSPLGPGTSGKGVPTATTSINLMLTAPDNGGRRPSRESRITFPDEPTRFGSSVKQEQTTSITGQRSGKLDSHPEEETESRVEGPTLIPFPRPTITSSQPTNDLSHDQLIRHPELAGPSNVIDTVKAQPSSDTLDTYPNAAPIVESVPEVPVSPPEPTPALTPEQNRFEYKAAKLLPEEVGSTVIKVEGSTIRPNDRGKEVVSFIIFVAPKGKEPWKVEKLYSDVLTLDARIRAAVGKTQSKKMGALPENRLFKDNAPAKVDQRKAALEVYFQTLVSAGFRRKDDICMFFSTGIVRPERAPVHVLGHKEGYLTKRGKNFGGFLRWKTRYFVLQGATLEYYESRGGQHLGSIYLGGAQIGRQQQRSGIPSDDDNAFRHAFLIIEGKKQSSSSVRHVLCGESDTDRECWIDALSMAVAVEDDRLNTAPQPTSVNTGLMQRPATTRSSTSSSVVSPTDLPTAKPTARRAASRDDMNNVREMGNGSSVDLPATAMPVPDSNTVVRKIMGKGNGSSVPFSSSMPTSLDHLSQNGQIPRASSELGHYPDMADNRPNPSAPRPRVASYNPAMSGSKSSLGGSRDLSLDSGVTTTTSSKGKVISISGPSNGMPIPPGYSFGVKDSAAGETNNERERKVKSGIFTRLTKGIHGSLQPQVAPRAVFGVVLPDALAVSQIANLPAVAFRCIQYLEAQHAEQEEGIYRLSGSSAAMKSLKERFNAEGDIDLMTQDEFYDLHAISGLLKTYIREIPGTILSHQLHFRFLRNVDFAEEEEKIADLQTLVAMLPFPNYCLLRAVIAHLILIVQHATVNRMTMRNVGIILSPTLQVPAGVLSLMLSEFQRVFNVDGDFVETGFNEPSGPLETLEVVPRLRDQSTAIHPSKRNSLNYAESSADRLLGLAGRTLTAADEGDSDEEPESIIQEDSGTETDATQSVLGSDDIDEPADNAPGLVITSSPDTPNPNSYRPSIEITNLISGTPTKVRTTHSAAVAATRGLHIRTERARSQLLPGPSLPSSPRPNASPRPMPRSGASP